MPTLVDSNIWMKHFRASNTNLSQLLSDDEVLTHPFIIGEISCGNLKQREEIIPLLKDLPLIVQANDSEVYALIERERLFGQGLGWIDIHLLASCILQCCSLWTDDKALNRVAKKFVEIH